MRDGTQAGFCRMNGSLLQEAKWGKGVLSKGKDSLRGLRVHSEKCRAGEGQMEKGLCDV